MRLPCAILLAAWSTLVQADERPRFTDVAYGPAGEQRFDLYRPATAGSAPVILMVHGGGWRRGDKEMSRVVEHKRQRWLPRGIALVSTNYRMLPEAAPLEQARDVARALAKLQQNAAAFGIDDEEVVLMGHSAGAHLIALLAARPELLREASARPPRGYVLLDSGALDVPAIMTKRHFRLYDQAFGKDPEYWQAVSPWHQLRQPGPPLLAVCSSRRREACRQAEDFIAKARSLGTAGEVLALPMAHGEINERLGEDAGYTATVERFLAGLSPRLAERLR